MVRRGYITAFTVPASDETTAIRLVVIARTCGEHWSRSDPQPALDAIQRSNF